MGSPPPDKPEPAELSTFARPLFRPTDTSTDFVLTVVEGSERGRTLAVAGSQPNRTLLGSGPACNLVLHDREVSRRHAAVEPAGRRLRITDLGSTNGTFVDGIAIVEVFLRGGGIVRLGSTALQVDCGPAAAQPALPVPHELRAPGGREHRDAPPLPAVRAPRGVHRARGHRRRDRHGQGGAGRGAPRGGPRGADRSWSSTARRCPPRSSSPSCSVTSAARSPARPRARASSSRPTAAPCSSTRSAISICRCSQAAARHGAQRIRGSEADRPLRVDVRSRGDAA